MMAPPGLPAKLAGLAGKPGGTRLVWPAWWTSLVVASLLKCSMLIKPFGKIRELIFGISKVLNMQCRNILRPLLIQLIFTALASAKKLKQLIYDTLKRLNGSGLRDFAEL